MIVAIFFRFDVYGAVNPPQVHFNQLIEGWFLMVAGSYPIRIIKHGDSQKENKNKSIEIIPTIKARMRLAVKRRWTM